MANEKEALKLAMKAINFMCCCKAPSSLSYCSVTHWWSVDVRERGRKLKKQIEKALKGE